MTVNPDYFRASSEAEVWNRLVTAINDEFASVDLEAARRKSTATLSEKDAEAERTKALEPARLPLSQAVNAQWGGYRLHYTLGQLDTEVLILLAEKRTSGWQDIFNAKASFGTPEDLVNIQRQALLAGTTVNVTAALPYAAKPFLIVNGLRHEGNIQTTEQLFKMGADPSYDNNGQLFSSVVEAGRADIGRLFGKYGLGVLNVEMWANSAKSSKKMKLFDDLRRIQWEFGRFTVVDSETLMEQKPLPDTGNLKIIFNFASRRVTEIFEIANPKQAVMKDYTFDDYGQNALEAAHDKLTELGGKPSGVETTLRGKAPIAKPATARPGLTAKPEAG